MQFNSDQEINRATRGLLKVLKLPIEHHPKIAGNVCSVHYGGLVRHEVERAAKKVGYKTWKYNKQILVFKGGLAPILLLNETLVLLGISVPEWNLFIRKPKIDDTDNGFLGILKPTKEDLEDHRDYINLELKEKNGLLYQPCKGLSSARDLDNQYLDDVELKNNEQKEEYKLNPVFKDLDKTIVDAVYHADSSFSKSTMLKLVEIAWEDLNRVKFNNKLKKPRFEILKNMGADSLKTRGVYYPYRNALGMSPRAFNGDVNNFFTVLLHEMCHQATFEISNDYSMEEGGHGPTWRNWMEKVGLPPLRYDDVPNEKYRTKNEIYLRDKVERYVHNHELKQDDRKQGMLCGVYDSYEKTIRECVIVKILDPVSCFISVPGKSTLSRASFTTLCTLPKYTIDKKYAKQLQKSLEYYDYTGPLLKPER